LKEEAGTKLSQFEVPTALGGRPFCRLAAEGKNKLNPNPAFATKNFKHPEVF
jgi:hypothetical protein